MTTRGRRTDMDWYWNGWVVLTVIIYVIGSIMLLGFADEFSSWWGRIVAYIVAWAICFAILNGVTMMISTWGEGPRLLSVKTVSKELGLESGKVYQVKLGTRVQGSTGTGHFYGGVFSSGGRISLQPGSSISMGFASGNSSYILEVPISGGVSFVKSTSVDDATVQLYLKEAEYGGSEFGSQTLVSSTCNTAFYSLVFWQLCENTYENVLASDVKRRGLAPIVTKYFDGATITLSPELYDRLLGTP